MIAGDALIPVKAARPNAVDLGACQAVRPRTMDQKAAKEANLPGTFSPARKERARLWFEHLRDDICAGLERVEDEAEGLPGCAGNAAGRFVKTPWTRAEKGGEDGGGGVMALMTGRGVEGVGRPP